MKRIRSLLSGDGMKARAIRGTLLSLVGFGGAQILRLASNLILTRILFPEAFGLMALVQVVLVGLEMFSDLGLRPAIVQSARGDEEDFLNTAWVVQILRGGLLWLIASALALPVAEFYDQPALAAMIPVLALTTVISGFDSTRLIQANRHLRLAPQITVGLSSQFLGTVAMILLALWLDSVWALVLGSIVGAFCKAVLSHVVAPGPRNRFAWDREAATELFHFGKYIFVATIAAYFLTQGDRVVLGKFVTLEVLALFTIAFFLANVPVNLNQKLVERVLLPLYRNRAPAESPSNRRRIGQARTLLVAGFLAILTVIALVGVPLIEFLYDPRYRDAGPMLVLLALSMMPGLILAGYKQILLANGNSRDFTIFNVGSAILYLGLLVVLIRAHGIIGAIVTPFLVNLLTYPALAWFVRPYRGWYPAMDGAFLAVSLVVSALALWLYPDARALLGAVLPW